MLTTSVLVGLLPATVASPSPNRASSFCCLMTPWRWSLAPRFLAVSRASSSMPTAGSAPFRHPVSATTSLWAKRQPWHATSWVMKHYVNALFSTPTAPAHPKTVSHVFDMVAQAYGIRSWPVAAVKAFIGHSQGSAAGDQLTSALGSFAHGLLPGIPTLDAVADDVHAERLRFFRVPYAFQADAAFINAKGFGGNNATGVVLSPGVTERLLTQRHGETAMRAWRERREATRQASQAYLEAADRAHFDVRYRFGEGVLEGPELKMNRTQINIPGYARPVSLAVDNPFGKLED